jgi:hypothetical protein
MQRRRDEERRPLYSIEMQPLLSGSVLGSMMQLTFAALCEPACTPKPDPGFSGRGYRVTGQRPLRHTD